MSGIYAMKQKGDEPPEASPMGGLGDIGAALFATVGLLAALRERDRTGQAQFVDVAMFDSVLAMTDIVSNFWSLGLKDGEVGPLINNGFRAGDGWIIVQVDARALLRARWPRSSGIPSGPPTRAWPPARAGSTTSRT